MAIYLQQSQLLWIKEIDVNGDGGFEMRSRMTLATILIAADELRCRRVLRTTLTSERYFVVEATCGDFRLGSLGELELTSLNGNR